MTKREVCAYLGISPRTTNERVKEGKLHCQYVTGKHGQESRFRAEDVERLKRDMETPVMRTDVMRTDVVRSAETALEPTDVGAILFDAAGKPEPVDRILALAETLRVGEQLGIPRRDVIAWHRAALQPRSETPLLTQDELVTRFAESFAGAVAKALQGAPAPAPMLTPHMTLAQAVEYSGMPASFLVAAARAGTIRAVNVGKGKREFWRFAKEAVPK
jgi:hypothetical protein